MRSGVILMQHSTLPTDQFWVFFIDSYILGITISYTLLGVVYLHTPVGVDHDGHSTAQRRLIHLTWWKKDVTLPHSIFTKRLFCFCKNVCQQTSVDISHDAIVNNFKWQTCCSMCYFIKIKNMLKTSKCIFKLFQYVF